MVRSAAVLILIAFGSAWIVPVASGQGVVVFSSNRCDPGEGYPSQYRNEPPTCVAGVFLVNDDGTDLRRLTSGVSPGDHPISGDRYPSWSPGGTHVAFSRQTNESAGAWRAFVVRSDGSDAHPLLTEPLPPGYRDEENLEWSPTGDRIAFHANNSDWTGFHQSIFTVAPDGSRVRLLTTPDEVASTPAFTPDGRKIAYVNSDDASVYQRDLDGSNRIRLTFGDAPVIESGIAFSPDGRYIALTLRPSESFEFAPIYTMAVDGRELTRRTESTAFGPIWSSFGPSLIYGVVPGTRSPTFNGDAHSQLYKVNLRTGEPPVQLTGPNFMDGRGDWTLAQGALPPAPPVDLTPPAVTVTQGVAVKSSARVSSRLGAGPSARSPRTSRLPFLAADRSGIRRVDAAVGLRVGGGRCRPMAGTRFKAARRCSIPLYRRVPSGETWRRWTAGLGAGTYEVRFRTTDTEGNSTRRPEREVVRIRG